MKNHDEIRKLYRKRNRVAWPYMAGYMFFVYWLVAISSPNYSGWGDTDLFSKVIDCFFGGAILYAINRAAISSLIETEKKVDNEIAEAKK